MLYLGQKLTIFKTPRVGNPGKRIRKLLFSLPQICSCCGSTESLTLDHKLARCFGGTNHTDNIQLLCYSCNQIKATKEYRIFTIAWELLENREYPIINIPSSNSLGDFFTHKKNK